MKDEIFERIVDQTKKSMQSVWSGLESQALNEQAVPSYLNENKIVSHIFWQRIRAIVEELEKQKPKVILDFGCGIGTLFLFFKELQIPKVIACDNERHAIEGAKKILSLNEINNIELLHISEGNFDLPEKSIDAIIALDVLEHIENIDGILGSFYKSLRSQGYLYVSGPTENWLYKFSRKFGGKHYKDHFHVSDIYEIENKIKKRFNYKLIRQIWPIITFFRLSKSQKK